MSARVAAGCARSRFQSVSVVPISQWFFHGMTNSTDVDVRRISPASPVICRAARRCARPSTRAPGTGRAPPDSAWISSVHTPVQLSTTPARTTSRGRPRRRAPARRRPGRTRARSRPPGWTAGRPRRNAPPCGRRSACAARRRPARRSNAPPRSSASSRSPGNIRSAARRERCFWPGRLLRPPIVS